MLELAWGAGTHTGLRRKRNEDAYLARPPLFAVADGMGGHARGDVAATLAIEALHSLAPPASEAVSPRSAPSRAPGSGDGLTRAGILDAVRAADRTIAAQAGGHADRAMGTTVCGLIALPDDRPGTVLIFNVGDSRVYRHRPGNLAQLTHDHSVVQELIDEGRIDEREAAIHPERNVITRSLGSGVAVDIDWWTIDALPGDQFLLCSDGLVREVSSTQVAEILATPEPPQEKVDRLIVAALEGGGRDNVTVVVVEIVDIVDLASTPDSHDLAVDTNPRLSQADTNPRAPVPLVGAGSQPGSTRDGQQPGVPADTCSVPDTLVEDATEQRALIDLADVPGMGSARGDLASTHPSSGPMRP